MDTGIVEEHIVLIVKEQRPDLVVAVYQHVVHSFSTNNSALGEFFELNRSQLLFVLCPVKFLGIRRFTMDINV